MLLVPQKPWGRQFSCGKTRNSAASDRVVGPRSITELPERSPGEMPPWLFPPRKFAKHFFFFLPFAENFWILFFLFMLTKPKPCTPLLPPHPQPPTIALPRQVLQGMCVKEGPLVVWVCPDWDRAPLRFVCLHTSPSIQLFFVGDAFARQVSCLPRERGSRGLIHWFGYLSPPVSYVDFSLLSRMRETHIFLFSAEMRNDRAVSVLPTIVPFDVSNRFRVANNGSIWRSSSLPTRGTRKK